jgi:hypothetical protein
MPTQILKALDKEIGQVEARLSALRQARSALAGTKGGRTSKVGVGKPGRRKFTAAQRREISRRMKAAWKKRKAATKKAGKK